MANITAMVYQVLQLYSVSLNMSEMTVIKWEFPKGALCLENDKQTPSCETNPKQVTHEGSHYRISTTDREFVSCVVCLRMTQLDYDNSVHTRYTAISRKVVEKSARDDPERYCGWFLAHCFSKKFQTMAREAMDVCLRVLKVWPITARIIQNRGNY